MSDDHHHAEDTHEPTVAETEHGAGTHDVSHDDHDAHTEHGEHGQHWGDYNTKPPGPTNLPPLNAVHLLALGLALGSLLTAAALFSLNLRIDEGGHGTEHAKTHGAEHSEQK
ncbi:MAG TPA: hypothetical protein VGP72_33580 [Planctomycetota bacterium]|jgi:hypothetical protein